MKLKDFIANEEWTFAKTYAEKAPHEYVMRNKCKSTDEEFMMFIRAIEKYGQVLYFWNHPNKYLYLDGRYYWTMGTKMNEHGEIVFDEVWGDRTAVINRSNAKDYFVNIRWKGLPK